MSTPATDAGTPLQTALRRPKTDEERRRQRELEQKYKRYQCHECSEPYADDYDAARCCGPAEVYVCPSCEGSYSRIEDAQECEAAHGPADDAPLAFARCPVCKTACSDHEDAIECCLWKTMPFGERLQLERLVRYGRIDEAHAMLRSH
jgi:hypothetical protein